MKMNRLSLLLIPVLALMGCSKDDAGKGKMNVRMTDAPAGYEEVNVEVIGVEVTTDNGKIELSPNAGVYNLLDFANGKDTLIATGDIPEGRVNQIRLILGTNNTVKIDGTTYPLETPSAQQSGLKLNLHQDIKAGVTYSLLLDFEAAKSIVHTGSDKYILKPVIRLIAKAESGAIKGVVSPAAVHPAVYAIMGADTFSGLPDTLGRFLIQGLAAGSYDVHFVPDTPYAVKMVNGVGVTIDQVTEMDTVKW